jgi:hypothetical protein
MGSSPVYPERRIVARTDVPTCALSEQLEAVRERVQAAGWDQCIVVNEQGIVLGRRARRS